MTYADIIIDISHEKLDRTFQYRVPEHLEEQVHVGMVAAIPFGNGNHIRKGYIIGLSREAKFDPGKIKEIQSLCSGEETTESRLIALAAWMKENYGSTMIQALKTVLPIQEKMKAKEKRYLHLTCTRQEGQQLLENLQNTRFKARSRLLEALLASEDMCLDYTEGTKELGVSPSVMKYFEEQGILRIDSNEVYRMPLDESAIPREAQMPLTPIQQDAVSRIRREWQRELPRPVLLRGVTGSGKTQVYMELIQQVIDQGQQAIVLIPEIALTYQTVRRFYGRFGNKVSVLNSRLSAGERYDQFRRAKRGEIQIMVGPRSALFTPFSRLGLIVIDEEHEPTYKSENSPRYHARETAIRRAQMEGARVILGSATPSIEAYSRAMSGEYTLVTMESRYEARPLPQVSIVDLREELKAGNRSVLSRSLKEALEGCLKRGEQAMLFLNRRGYAGFVSCRSCGHVMKCPHCDVSLSQHNNGKLICHYCGYEIRKPEKCSVCSSPYIGGFKAGTQQIEQVIRQNFPEAGVLRMDYDTTRNKGSYEKILAAFAAHEADILIGTQMIVKGHDFPDVTLVGVIAADMSLNDSDYRCGERTFQLLTQAVGRAGRGMKLGQAIIQTYHPDHYSIQASALQDYEDFYQEEMSYRMLLDYPPASHMLAVLGSCEDEELLSRGMYYIEQFIRKIHPEKELHLIGPAPAPVGKIKDVYKKVLYMKQEDYSVLVHTKDKIEKYIEINSGFRKIYIQFDFT
jgi:primosomal protein N' (replication factor Y)